METHDCRTGVQADDGEGSRESRDMLVGPGETVCQRVESPGVKRAGARGPGIVAGTPALGHTVEAVGILAPHGGHALRDVARFILGVARLSIGAGIAFAHVDSLGQIGILARLPTSGETGDATAGERSHPR